MLLSSYILYNVIKLKNLWKIPVKKFIFIESTGQRPAILLKTKILKVLYKDFYDRQGINATTELLLVEKLFL